MATISIDQDKLENFLSKINQGKESGRVTMTTVFCKAFGNMFHESNSFGKITFGNFTKAKSMDVAVVVDIGE